MRTAKVKQQPLDFLKLLAHDIRWRILLTLSRSDRKVEELVKQIKQPHNLISYHLKLLRNKRLVSERRSSVDGRDIYYSLNLDQFKALYDQAGASVHPALGNALPRTDLQAADIQGPKSRVLFLCTHNSARSQMAEALLRQLGSDQVDAFSAGNEPTALHPLAIKEMAERGIDIRQQRTKHLNEYVGQDFDYIVTVCDRVRESCPVFPGDPKQIHWSIPDPAAVEGNQQTKESAFSKVANELSTRIEFLLLVIKHDREEQG